VLVSIYST